jgi:ribosomal protein L7/L12
MGLFSNSDPRSASRLRIIERKLDAIIDHLGIKLPHEEDFPEVRELAAQRRTIEAIKLYREQTGASLKDAKDFVDLL